MPKMDLDKEYIIQDKKTAPSRAISRIFFRGGDVLF